MATDRYSDDYTIVVSGGSGTMTIDSDLEITGGLSFAGSLAISGDLAVTGSITGTDLNLSGSGTSNIISEAGSITITSSVGDIEIICQNTLGLYASLSGTAGTIEISPAGPSAPFYTSVYMTLSEADDKITIGGPTLSIIADAVELSAEITYPTARGVSLAIPYVAFSRDNVGNTVASVENNNGNIKIDGGGGASRLAYLEVPLPDSIPDGSAITAIWGGFEWSGMASANADVTVKLYECAIGDSPAYTEIDSDSKQISNDSIYYFKSFSITHTVSKNKATIITVVVNLPSNHDMWFYGLRVMYDTGRVDINFPI